MSATRRNFLVGGMVMASTIACSITTKQSDVGISHSIPDQPLPERVLGKTGVKVPIFGLGGAGQTPLSRIGEESAAIDRPCG